MLKAGLDERKRPESWIEVFFMRTVGLVSVLLA